MALFEMLPVADKLVFGLACVIGGVYLRHRQVRTAYLRSSQELSILNKGGSSTRHRRALWGVQGMHNCSLRGRSTILP